MDKLVRKYGNWAFIAGAAEGIGEAYTRALARRGFNLILLDNQSDSLNTLVEQLNETYDVKIITLHMDLGTHNAASRILEAIQKVNCRFIVYVAAYSKIKPFIQNTTEELDAYVNVNMRTPLHLFHGFIDQQESNAPAGILLMSSLGSLWGTKLLIPYGATKAFDLVLAESLHYELKPRGIDVMACVAGATTTPTYLASNPRYGKIKPPLQQPEKVAESALLNFGKMAVYISGWQNKLSYFIMSRIFSRQGAAKIFNRTISKMYTDKL